ncbi:hypothetical protein JRQ81_019318, partial [Phrynocephalus forsythii]
YQVHKKYFADRKKDLTETENESESVPPSKYSTMNGGFVSEEGASTAVSVQPNGK